LEDEEDERKVVQKALSQLQIQVTFFLYSFILQLLYYDFVVLCHEFTS